MAGEFKELYLNNTNYTQATYVSELYSCSNYSSIVLTVYCNNNCSMKIEYFPDRYSSVIITETGTVTGGSSTTLTSSIKASYIKMTVYNIVNPSNLKVQGFYLI